MYALNIDGLPALEINCFISLQAQGTTAFLRATTFVCAVSLDSGRLNWVITRQAPRYSESSWGLPRRIQVSGSDLWVAENGIQVAEITATEVGGIVLTVRDARTAALLWEKSFAMPDAADWAEPAPAWPGAPTEEIYAFFADDSRHLVLCFCRHSRRSGLSAPSRGIHVFALPPFRCQTDAVRFDPGTGRPMWQTTFRDVPVHIVERKCFTGIWSNGGKAGIIDLAVGTNHVLLESPQKLGWPVRDGLELAVPWHAEKKVGVTWIDEASGRMRQSAWRTSRVRSTVLHKTESGIAMQTNDQTLSWLAKDDVPAWSIRAKPYIYRVHCCPGSDLFVATDGNGGRLFGFDTRSGQETLNLRPALGGVGHLTRVPGHNLLVSSYCVSRNYSTPARLLVLSMLDRTYEISEQCWSLVGAWEHGAICRTGKNGEQLSVVNLQTGGTSNDRPR